MWVPVCITFQSDRAVNYTDREYIECESQMQVYYLKQHPIHIGMDFLWVIYYLAQSKVSTHFSIVPLTLLNCAHRVFYIN